jgi:hypothetical protein
MKTHRYTLLLAASFLALSSVRSYAQTNAPLARAVEGPTLAASAGANDNRSAVVFNPEAGLYYSLDAGCMRYPADTYGEDGTFLGTVEQGFDYRGGWWDPVMEQLEGNGYAEAGIFVQTLDGTTHRPMGTGTTVHDAAQPHVHSVGTLDTEADEVIYYHDGAVHRYAHATNILLGRLPIAGLPVAFSDMNDNSIAYTGNPGYEYGLYDHVERRLLFINKATGAYAGYCQLPATAPRRTSFGVSYANGYFWLFDAPSNPGTWRSYRVFATDPVMAEEPEEPVLPEPVVVAEEPEEPVLPKPAVLAEEPEEPILPEPAIGVRTVADPEAVQAEAQPAAQQEGGQERELAVQPTLANVSLFPVPASDLLHIEMTGAAPLQGVRVLDLSGRLVLAPLMRTGTGSAQLDVKALPTGAYGLEVLTADGATRHSFVVAR